MREIKFRVWDEFRMLSDEELRMVAKELYSEVGKGGQYEGCILISNCEDLKVMQYTGLKDKNGTEIYESDIVQTKRASNIKGYVTMYKGSWCIYNGHKYYRLFHDFPEIVSPIEIKGNIYENPELLEGIE